MPETTQTVLRIAVAQSTVREDPTNAAELRENAQEIRRLMKQAADAGARLVHFTEGATCWPSKYVMSELGPDEVGNADWSRFEWKVLQEELDRITTLAGELGIWTVFGAVHQLPAPARPYNSLYVISDQGKVATRYDERTLSTTKITYMYTPGNEPVTFEVDGFRFGLAVGMDAHFPELFTAYERLDVDGVLMSTTGSSPAHEAVAHEVRGHAAANSYWISLALPAQHAQVTPSGVIDWNGNWAAECPPDGKPAIAVTDLHRDDQSPLARDWRRRTRERINS